MAEPLRNIDYPQDNGAHEVLLRTARLKSNLKTFNNLLPPSIEKLAELRQAIIDLHEAAHAGLQISEPQDTLQKENLQNSAKTALVILEQPLSIPKIDEDVSLYEAAKKHLPSQGEESHLYKTAQVFSEYPEQTEALKIEINLGITDLE